MSGTAEPPGPADRLVADRMATAALAWLDSLDPGQRRLAQRSGPAADAGADGDRLRWHYTPTDHGGLPLGQQGPVQQSRAMELLASGLSTSGYVTVCAVMGLENVLDRAEGFPLGGSRQRLRDPGLYYVRIFGEPGGRAPWGWRFGGHHVSVNNLVVDGRVRAVTPCFLGANPAAAPLLGGGTLRLLGATEDLARQLVRSLPPSLAARAVLSHRPPPDILSRNRPRLALGDEVGQQPAPEGQPALTAHPAGVPGSELDDAQRELLRALLAAYVGRVPDGLSAPVELDAVHVAWAGSTEPGQPHYYRLQGPRLLVEWDNTQRNGNHAHSVWRDPQADFGLDALGEHRAAYHRA
jgi:Protein of unknown function (DUF3500)